MKGIFRKNSGADVGNDSGKTVTGLSASGSGSSLRSLGPQFSVPPFPHPLPASCITLQYTPDGLLILPLARQNPLRHSVADKDEIHTTTSAGPAEDVATDKFIHNIQASSNHSENARRAVRLEWSRDAVPTTIQAEEASQLLSRQQAESDTVPVIYCYGIVGILRVFEAAHLLVVTNRTPVGDFLRAQQPVYKCSGVLPIPLTREGARVTMTAEMARQRDGRDRMAKGLADAENDDSENESGSDEDNGGEDNDDVTTPALSSKLENPLGSSHAVATLRALQNHYPDSSSSRGGGVEGHEQHSNTAEKAKTVKNIDMSSQLTRSGLQPSSSERQWHDAARAELEEKVVRETARQYARGEMWFTYDFDLTTSAQRKEDAFDRDSRSSSRSSAVPPKSSSTLSPRRIPSTVSEPWATLPLWRRVDRRFWHNEHLSRDFAREGFHSLVLPLMQGYFQVTDLPLDAQSPASNALDPAGDAMSTISDAISAPRLQAQLLVISRRSKERAGLRFQRRGVNEQGQVANYVETEQILFLRRGSDEVHVMSFVQFRGSIPLYWRQDPFTMKPPPQLEGSAEDNGKAFAKHFEQQVARYGGVICINLAEQHGKEGTISKAYQDHARNLEGSGVKYKAFDFHEECKGMRFERVNKLIDDLKKDELQRMNCFWKSRDAGGTETIFSRQKGAFRVSCLDCLDRTNVVEAAFGRYVLGVQLDRLGIHVSTEKNERREDFDFAFNDSWANNGDMISQIYAGTKALKGDFTRTGKRNLMGMINDATNSVYRMVRGAVSDFFKQTVIDFQYGYTSLSALERYNDNLAVSDPAVSSRLARVRSDAVEACARNVILSGEQLLAGWSLFSPIEPNRIETPKLEEKILLLTKKALYCCGYDFTSQKVAEFSRILLGDIVGIKRGIYILSPHEGYHPDNHWGIVIYYLNEERRLNTSSIRSKPDSGSLTPGATNFIAFRAVVDDANSAAANMEASSRFLDSSERTMRLKSKQEPSDKSLFTRLAKAGRRGASEAAVGDPSAFMSTTRSSLAVAPHVPTSHDIIDAIVEAIIDQCIQSGSCAEDDEDFLKEETIQSLAQARAMASLFTPLIDGLKRRVWL